MTKRKITLDLIVSAETTPDQAALVMNGLINGNLTGKQYARADSENTGRVYIPTDEQGYAEATELAENTQKFLDENRNLIADVFSNLRKAERLEAGVKGYEALKRTSNETHMEMQRVTGRAIAKSFHYDLTIRELSNDRDNSYSEALSKLCDLHRKFPKGLDKLYVNGTD